MDARPATEHELIDRCLDGDDEAWRELVGRYQGLIYSVPLRMGLAPEDAADVFQRVCILLYRRVGSIRDPERLGGWLATTASREALRVVRGRRHHVSLEDDERGAGVEPVDVRPLADDERVRIEQAQMLRSAIAELSERCRALMTELLRSDGGNYREVARRLDIPIGSIGPTRARCFARLRALLEERGLKL